MAATLEDLLSDDDDERDAAIAALGSASAAARAALLPGLLKELAKRLKGAKDDDNEFDRPAAALLVLGLPEADQAVAAAADHKNADVRSLVPALFAERPSELGASVIAKLAADKNEDVRAAAFEALCDAPTAAALDTMLKQADKAQADEAPVLQALAACARDASADVRATVEAKIDKKLASKDAEAKESALAALGKLGSASPALVEKVRGLAASKAAGLKASALAALALVGDDRAGRLGTLVELAAKGTRDEAASAATALRDLPADVAAPALLTGSSHALPAVRAAAVLLSTSIPALAERADAGRIEALLSDPDEAVRAHAAHAAARLVAHAKRFKPLLQSLAKDGSKDVQKAAKLALEELEENA